MSVTCFLLLLGVHGKHLRGSRTDMDLAIEPRVDVVWRPHEATRPRQVLQAHVQVAAVLVLDDQPVAIVDHFTDPHISDKSYKSPSQSVTDELARACKKSAGPHHGPTRARGSGRRTSSSMAKGNKMHVSQQPIPRARRPHKVTRHRRRPLAKRKIVSGSMVAKKQYLQ